mmetsp:Transcript_8903/g.12083  ORF Transcript_8903/g.12083 Transcript_8903/m.12083 type:complete len:372 (-) Transcript_8903:117-1232(-)
MPSCRICLDDEDEINCRCNDHEPLVGLTDNSLVRPCSCRGSSTWIHLCCLLEVHLKCESLNSLECPTCKQIYFGEVGVTLARQNLEHSQRKKRSSEKYGCIATSTALNNLASMLSDIGKYGEALPLYEQSLAISEEIYGSNHPSVATSLNNLAVLLKHQGLYKRAEPLLERALSLYTAAPPGSNHDSQLASALNNLALLYKETGRLQEAFEMQERCVRLLESTFGSNHLQVASLLNNTALLLVEMGRYHEAEKLQRRCLRIGERQHDAHHPGLLNQKGNLGIILKCLGHHKEAREYMEHALTHLRNEGFSPNHIWIRKFENHLQGMLPSNSFDEFDHARKMIIPASESYFIEFHSRMMDSHPHHPNSTALF